MNEGITSDLQEFLSRHISSVVQLELLLLLRSTVPREWTAAEIARELRIEPPWASNQAMSLHHHGLLICRPGSEPLYGYGPSDPALDVMAGQLAQTYLDCRVSVISFIHSIPVRTEHPFRQE